MHNSEATAAFELFRSRLLDSVMADLAKESDEHLALRKALLALIMLTQDGAGPLATRFIDHLICDFPPLAGYFSATDEHPLFSRHKVGRRRVKNASPAALSLKRSLVESMLTKPINSKEIATIGRLVPWELTAERHVGFFDIMGFRSFVQRYEGDPSAIHSIMSELHKVGTEAQDIHVHGKGGIHPGLNHPGSQLRLMHFSDSILALTRDASSSSEVLMQLTSQMLFLNALRLGIVIRGALARGLVTADFERSIFFGQPIIDAYLLEEDQAWYGVVEQPATVPSADLEDLESIGPDDIPLMVSHIVPRKSTGPTEMHAVNWPVFCKDRGELENALAHLRNDSSPKLHAYYTETLRFGLKIIEEFRS